MVEDKLIKKKNNNKKSWMAESNGMFGLDKGSWGLEMHPAEFTI